MPMTSLTDLWHEHHARLRGYIARRVGDRDAVDDILQEVFLKAHHHLHKLKSHGSVAAWLFRIAAHAIADHYRVHRPWEELPAELATPEPDPDPVGEMAACLQPLIDDLPECYRAALVLAEIEGLPQREVARRLGLSLSGAKSRVQRGRQQLRQRLDACCVIVTGQRGIVDYEPRDPGCKAPCD